MAAGGFEIFKLSVAEMGRVPTLNVRWKRGRKFKARRRPAPGSEKIFKMARERGMGAQGGADLFRREDAFR